MKLLCPILLAAVCTSTLAQSDTAFMPEGSRDISVSAVVARLPRGTDDRALAAAAARAGLAVSPLSTCYAGRTRRPGLILGYAGTPEGEIDAACARLAGVLRRL